MLAIHCTQANGGAWREVAKNLGPQVTVLAPDMPGHGRSGDWDGLEDPHDLTCRALAPLAQEGQIDLVGHSFGATIALRIAIENPGQVRSLCLIEPVCFAAAKAREPEVVETYLAQSVPYIEAIKNGDLELGARLFNRIWGSGMRWESYPPAARQYMCDRIRLVPAQSPSLFDDLPRLLAPERLARVTMPTLLIEGSDSPPVISAINAALADMLPHARRETIKGAAHMCPLTHPNETAEILRSLLNVT